MIFACHHSQEEVMGKRVNLSLVGVNSTIVYPAGHEAS